MRYYYKYFFFLVCLSLKEVESDKHKYRYDYNYNDVARGWFKTHILPAVWADARLRCAMEGAELAAPTTNTIKTVMVELIREAKSPKYFFTGIHAASSPGDFHTFQGIALTKLITNLKLEWIRNRKINKKYKTEYILMNKAGRIGIVIGDRSTTLPYICYRRGSLSTEHNNCGTVDNEYKLDTRTNKCYKFHTVPRNFSRAFLVCSAEGGHLAIINSVAEHDVLLDLSNKYKNIPVQAVYLKGYTYIGFHTWDEKFEWRTIHGQTLIDAGYNKWAKGQPDNTPPGEHCGAILNTDGLLMDILCEGILQFICEKHPRSLTNCHNECEMKLRKDKWLSKDKQKKEEKELSNFKSGNKHLFM